MTTRMAGYVLGDLLGKGGMGAVYAARRGPHGRTVAIKLLHPELATDPKIVERFRTEAIAGSRVSHPNLAGVIDFGESADGMPFLVMERVSGERLATLLERDEALSPRRACKLVGQILEALEAAHLAGVVHADVKSDNVLVERRDGRDVVTLIDFGIARLADSPPEADVPDRTLSGTPEYLAPEVIAGNAPSPASDLYAVGVVLYELLTGTTPFHGGTSGEIMQRHLEEEVIAPSLRRPEANLSAALDLVVLGALAKDPAQRHANAAVFASTLAAAMPSVDTPVVRQRPTGYSTEAPTQNWPAGRHPRARPSPERAERLRSAIGTAIVMGDPAAIVGSYLDLARTLVASRRADLAASELEQAVDVLTAGEGRRAGEPPPLLWRLLLALAAIYDGIGETSRAHAAARDAWLAANRAHSLIGSDRACTLLVRLAPT